MNLPIKYIAILVIVSLTAIFAYQTYWLTNLYGSMKEQTERTINSAIKNADHIELFCRADSISQKNEERRKLGLQTTAEGEISCSTSFEKDSNKKASQTVIKKKLIRPDSVLSESEKVVKSDKKSTDAVNIGHNYNSLQIMAEQMQSALHVAIDEDIKQINLSRFDSILRSDLIKAGLDIKHYTLIVQLKNDSIISSSLPAQVDTNKLMRYEFVYDLMKQRAFKVYTEATNTVILRQMSGILITSFVILLVLGLSFWYLIRVIMQQRTLEEMKSDFTNNMTHELKTPISVAYAANDALLNFHQAEEKEKREKYLRISQEQLQRLSRLVEQILSSSMEKRKNFQLHREEIDMHTLLNQLVEQHKMKADEPVDFTLHITPMDAVCLADKIHFSNALSNLIDNAIKYSPKTPQIDINCIQNQFETRISVTDKGMGIHEDKQKHIFDRFYRVPSGNVHNIKGYGLGLYYVKTIIQHHGGEILVKSELDKGSTFTIILPR